jgi:predicted RNA-binding Zn-ribbon protein involved in translation (DUF1610 family)
MADIRCPNCGDNLGKESENAKMVSCSNCGEDNIYNDYEPEPETCKPRARNLNHAKFLMRFGRF